MIEYFITGEILQNSQLVDTRSRMREFVSATC
jgi:hypothetical protein